MTEKNLFLLLTLFYLGTFITRNVLVKRRTKQKIRSSDPLVAASMVFTGLCILATLIAVRSEPLYRLMMPMDFLRHPMVSSVGLVLFACSILMGWVFSSQLKKSWRIGVHEQQKTELIQNGIYAHIRNPYFLSYFIMFSGLFLVRPCVVMGLLVIISLIIFHGMVLKEEAHLQKSHGTDYEKYKRRTGRYLPRTGK
ncbi:MAG: isoprenylcysteine carboxylmethyltransferase family protein [Proteobacteria bacterium]|nr:isoprenylcysteine carboxylmethyltransferase family protein [Pseudomonadota bacterium]MBU4472147.1 isoprenylcysteine carboxylmethyltransferase family protein [Pseudomonadota bacterium]MCG2753849.1 isoprenylcysteine carboxylmethyltransferase family protein [Desulfobacteraceae bacterium]